MRDGGARNGWQKETCHKEDGNLILMVGIRKKKEKGCRKNQNSKFCLISFVKKQVVIVIRKKGPPLPPKVPPPKSSRKNCEQDRTRSHWKLSEGSSCYGSG